MGRWGPVWLWSGLGVDGVSEEDVYEKPDRIDGPG